MSDRINFDELPCWSEDLQREAMEEGWGIYLTDEGACVGPCKGSEYRSDEEVWEYVTQRAKYGRGEIYVRLLAAVSRLERERIRSYTGY